MIILDGKKLAEEKAQELIRKISSLSIKPKLVIIQVGDREESTVYIHRKKLFAEKIGALCEHKKYPETVSAKKIIDDIAGFNADQSVHGIIVQLPLPQALSTDVILQSVSPKKDVDGLTGESIRQIVVGEKGLVPATARGIISLLEHYKIPIVGAKAVVVGRSILVGKPVALLLLNKGATVTICHRQTKNLEEETRRADIIIVAAGLSNLIGARHVRAGQTVVDVGITAAPAVAGAAEPARTAKGTSIRTVVGDVDFDAVKNIVAAISPVPGGVGPMTIASLFENLLEAYSAQV